MSSTETWLASTKSQELRDALNFVGTREDSGDELPALASQQGVRGSPIVDFTCVPGLELFKVAPQAGQGLRSGNSLGGSGDYLWASAGSLDLSFFMWNGMNQPGGTPISAGNQYPCFGVMLTGNTAADTQILDVFGRLPFEIVIVSGTFAWRMGGLTAGSGGGYLNTPGLQTLLTPDAIRTQFGDTFLNNNPETIGKWQSNNYFWGTQLPAAPVIPGLMYTFNYSVGFTHQRLTSLHSLMAANYATFRVYDFTLETQAGTAVPATMPPSASGVDTNNVSSGNSYFYINDAVVAPIETRSIAANSSFNPRITVAAGETYTIENVKSTAFVVTPAGEPYSVTESRQRSGPSYVHAYVRGDDSYTFRSSIPGTYTVILTAFLTRDFSKTASVQLRITVTSS